MKLQHLLQGFLASAAPEYEPSAISFAAGGGCKRLRPLAPKLSSLDSANPLLPVTLLDLKGFIRPDCSSPESTEVTISSSLVKVETQTHPPGGTRWNPTQEQIGILETLYRDGIRTPNEQQIEQITAQLRNYGKIEGKNVFYWFQNHKARERQKQKRNSLGLDQSCCPSSPASPTTVIAAIALSTASSREEGEMTIKDMQDSYSKRPKCRSWAFELLQEEQIKLQRCRSDHQQACTEARTLELFPLHPEGR
ncbi:hypothetical protein SAY87_011122 [Trapa incisa]|uniref:Homeobox domain-containing protein n=1 Tax=Trapa incisa TaxID=236973 RepID=A0AAN7GKL3_9MYRT|nr:hypothetical protein SAY87_011122 [Trapa incisa]